MNPDSKFNIASHAMHRQVGEETVILNLSSGTYFGLDPVGARIWQLLADGGAISDVVTTLLDEFDVERERLEQDVNALIQELVTLGLLEAQT